MIVSSFSIGLLFSIQSLSGWEGSKISSNSCWVSVESTKSLSFFQRPNSFSICLSISSARDSFQSQVWRISFISPSQLKLRLSISSIDWNLFTIFIQGQVQYFFFHLLFIAQTNNFQFFSSLEWYFQICI